MRSVNSRNLVAHLCQVQRESSLVATDIECTAGPIRVSGGEFPRPIAGGGVVRALIKKCAGLLACIGVVVESKRVEMKLRGSFCRGALEIERSCRRGCQPLKFAYAWIGALKNCVGRKLVPKYLHAGFAYLL